MAWLFELRRGRSREHRVGARAKKQIHNDKKELIVEKKTEVDGRD